MTDSKSGVVSFGFSKKREKKPLKNAALGNDETAESEQGPDFLTSVEDHAFQSTKPQEEVKELIIPLIETNRWYRPWKPSDQDHEEANSESRDSSCKEKNISEEQLPAVDSTTSAALKELLQEAKEGLTAGDSSDANLSIPLLMRNKVPEGYETDDKLDVSLRPNEAAVADYDQVPIESFGVALLKGMGWKPGQGIGRNNEAIKPLEAVLRPKGLGLGADKSLAQQAEGVKKNGATKDDAEEELELRAKAHCLVHSGKHEGLYGMVEGLDSDNARVVVQLTISGQRVTLSQYAVRAVSAKEHKKYSKYLNKSKAEKFKEELSRDSEQSGSDSDLKQHRHKHRHKDREADKHRHTDNQKDRHRDRYGEHRDTNRHRKHRNRDQVWSRSGSPSREFSPERHRERQRDKPGHRSRSRSQSKDRGSHQMHSSDKKRKQTEDRFSSQCKKSKHRDTDGSTSHCQGSSSRTSAPWMRPDLRVRVVDPKYKKGKYFKKKVVIEDVVSIDTCICRTEEGKVLEDLTQSMLETVIPKPEPAYVMLVAGKHKGQLAEILKKDKSSCKASIHLLSDRNMVFSVDYNHICEYTGDVNSAFDY